MNFDYVKIDDARGQSGVTVQIDIGTSGKDKSIQYGGLDSLNQFIGCGAGRDWVLQVGGSQESTMNITQGSGNDTIYQYGGQGKNTMEIYGGSADDTIIQVGGAGPDTMSLQPSDGNDYIEVYGGSGNNVIRVDDYSGDDVTRVYGGPHRNDITYSCFYGANDVTILGGRGYNTLTIKKLFQDFVLKDYQGNTLFQPGYDPPSDAPVAVLSESAGTVTAGLHAVKVGFRPRFGGTYGESGAPGPASAGVQADGAHSIDVSNIPSGPEGSVRLIYLNKAGGDTWYLAGTLDDNFSTTYTINISDSNLGSQGAACGFTNITVANLQRITVIGDEQTPIWEYHDSCPGLVPIELLLLAD